ncbi:MAG: N-6 DNA methylase [Terriglobia bacterium]
MDLDARKLAEVFKAASQPGVLEKPFREKVEKHLIEFAAESGLDLVPHTEVTLGTSGRADTIYNRFIIEWEKPGSFKPSNHATTNTHSIAQVKDYGDSLFWRTREKAGRIVGCCTDGRYLIFVTKPQKVWVANDPVLVTEQSCRKFLDYFHSLQSGVALLPDYLGEDFSSDNVRTQRAVKALYNTLVEHAAAPSLDAVFTQWAQFFGAVTEYEQWRVKLANETELRNMLKAFGIPSQKPDLNRFFFATHTFFAVLSKVLAYIIVGRYTDLPTPPLAAWKDLPNDRLVEQFIELEKGGPFHKAGIRNFLEGDFFSWYTKFFTPELADCLRAVVNRLSDYDPATLDLAPGPTQDLLKKLYHRLVPPHIRKALGEYYTPDWLAQRLLNMLDGGSFRGEPDKRLLDPACGSGTFLLMTINAIRHNSIAQSMNQGELLRKICRNVVGIDLNPLAVIAARTNYLLALGPLLKHRGKESLEIPVYLADSILTPSRGGSNLFEAEKVPVLLSIGKVELPRRLATQEGVAAVTDLLNKHLDKEPSTSPDKFQGEVKADLVARGAKWDEDAEVISALYATLHKLHSAGRNGMWARILKNAFAPVFLAPFDYIAGNPPWINWQNLPEGYRNETKPLWFDHGLFVHTGMDTILGKGKKDISALMTYVAADSYLKDRGRFGFVITQAVFKTSGAGQGFRRFVTRRGEPLGVTWVDDFSEMQLFEGASNRTAVFIMRKGQPTKYPVQYAYWRKLEGGRKGGFGYDATLDEVTSKTKRLAFVAEPVNAEDKTSAWLTGRPLAIKAVKKILGESDYEAHAGVYTGGANAVYWFEILHIRNCAAQM